MGDGQQEAAVGECRPHALFDSFVQASTCRETLRAFQELCGELQLQPGGKALFYHTLRSRLHYWKAKALWAKLDKRASQREYQRGRACTNTTCLIIGAGPCGLRTAIELSFLGARVVLVEKRDAFSRNNVLHLWPFTIQDLRGLGAKKFYGKFCAGAIDHIIRQLQLMLLKVALLLGVEVHVNVEFRSLREPPENQEKRVGWRAEVRPTTHAVSELQFDVVIGADGRRNTLPFHRKEFRGKLAIAITANFINRNTTAEAKVEEISGVAFIFNQRFFQELRNATIDLENIVYYKDDTHYFVMTAKKQSLLEKGVILRDYADTEMLLSRGNVDQNALLAYARQAADFSTNHQLPTLDFAINHYGQPDVAMFDFTCMYASENAALVRQRRGHSLLVALVGDSLLEPFWPMGTGIARGFLAAMDAGWMVRSWGMGASPLEVLAEESVYRLLPQTTPENVSKNYSQYSLDPSTRYPNINTQLISPAQVYHLIDTDEGPLLGMNMTLSPASVLNRQSTARSNKLLGWCQEQTEGYRSVCVTDLTTSWRNGLALCALIHRYRPDLDFDGLEESEAELNWQLGLEIAERELGVSPIMTIQELSMLEESDSLCMVMYLSQLHDLLKDTVPLSSLSPEERAALLSSTKSPMCLLNRLGQSLSRKRNPKDKKEKDADGVGKRRRTSQAGLSEDEEGQKDHRDDHAQAVSPGSETGTAVGGNQSRVRSMATQLLAKFEENAPSPSVAAIRRQRYIKMYTGGVSSLAEQIASQLHRQQDDPKPLFDRRELGSQRKEFPVSMGGSDVCYFCGRRVYVMERLSAEGKFFHRSCFQCDHCSSTLRLSNYVYDQLQKFYCKQHYSYRLAGLAQRKRPAPTPAPLPVQGKYSLQTPPVPPPTPLCVDTATPPDNWSSSTPPDLAAKLAKRLCGTPERIELENYRPCLQEQGSPLEEVPEEMLAQHNLSLSKGSEEQSTSDLPVTPEDSLSKRTEVIEEFWMKSAEIRKSLGLTTMSRDLTSTDGSSTHSSSTGDTFYTSNIHTPSLYTTASDSPSHTPHKYNSSNCTRSTQTPSSTDFESSAHMHSSSGTPGSSRSGTSVAGEPGTGPEQVIARCSMVHRLNITLEGHVMEDRVASASNHVSRIIGNNHRDLAPESGLLTPPCSPPVARCYRLAAEPAVEREILLNSGISHPSMLQKERLQKKGMVSVQRLPPDEVEVLCADEAHPYANATPVDATNQLPSRSSLMDQHKTSSFPNISSAPAPEHAGKDKREGRRTLTEGPLQVGGAEVWLRRPEAGKSGAEEKEKKRSSLFSPRKSRKGGDTQQETTKHKSLWKSVFSGYKKEKKRKEAAALAATLPSGADQESRRRMASLGRTTLCFKKTLSLSEDSDLSCNAVMERSPLRTQKTGAEEELDAKLTRRVQRAARRQAKQEELRRLHRAQIIQRQLEQVEVKQRQLEEKGIAVEKALRGEAYWEDSSISDLLDVHLGMGKKDDPSLMQQWFKLVQEKNALVRYESELMIARELELEDRQSRLQQELRERMAVDHLKGEDELEEEKCILGEMLDVVEQRDALVALLEEQRVREREEDSDLEAVMLSKGFNMHWA
uniref:F-actin monooxygenase n=1 Tax=Astyanax mexicanus TaxID=7994 RepID=W5KRE5_ASTMX